MLKSTHVILKSWDTHFIVPTFDFYFKVMLPKPNKERVILERDNIGRIMHSIVPDTLV